jgi:RIO-like serine/threonine protein kinase
MYASIIHEIGAYVPEPLPMERHATIHAYAYAMLNGRRTGQGTKPNIILARRIVRFLNAEVGA